jgi:hypothetical protein
VNVSHILLGAIVTLGLLAHAASSADPRRDTILAELLAQAQQDEPGFAGFSAERGAAFYRATHTGGKQSTGSCTACHGNTPQDTGQTRVGKTIAPMAVSKNRHATPTRAPWRSGSPAIAMMYWGGPVRPKRRVTFSPI